MSNLSTRYATTFVASSRGDGEGRPFIVVKALDGAGGYEPGSIVVDRHRRLTCAEWRTISDELVAMRFWALPSHPCRSRAHLDDGFVWILEGKLENEYAVVQWHWDECHPCRLLAGLAEVELEGAGPPPSRFTPSHPPPPELP